MGLTSAVGACLPARTGSGSDGPSFASSSQVSASPPATEPPSGPPGPRSFIPPTPTPAPTFLVYVVVAGDNLNIIARHFGTTARSIAFWNRATYPSLDPLSSGYRPDIVRIGWTLLVVPNLVFDEQNLPGDTAGPSEPAAS